MPGETDLLGEPKGEELDVSDEGLEARGWEPDTLDPESRAAVDAGLQSREEAETDNAVSEADDDVAAASDLDAGATTDEGETTQEPATPEAASDDEAGPENLVPDTTSSEDDLPEQFRGKSPQELVQIIQESQAQISRQGNEVGELRKAVEESKAEQQRVLAAIQASQYEDPFEYAEPDEIRAEDLQGNYFQLLNLVDQGAAPMERLDSFIENAYEVNTRVARQLDRDLTMRIARAEQAQAMQPVIEKAEATTKAQTQATLRQVTNDLWNSEPDMQVYAEEVRERLQGWEPDGDAGSMREVLLKAMYEARGADPFKSALYQQRLEDGKLAAQTPQGSPPPAEPAPLSDADAFRQQIAQAKDTPDFFDKPLSDFVG